MDPITQLYLLVGFLFVAWLLAFVVLIVVDDYQWEKRSKG